MAANSEISWTHDTFNPWYGCQKVSPACKFCYAERDVNRYGGDFHSQRIMTSAANWSKPLSWDLAASQARQRRLVFCASWADIFEEYDGPIWKVETVKPRKLQRVAMWPNGSLVFISEGEILPHVSGGARARWVTMDDLRARLINMINATPHLTWLLLTKRPENILPMLERIKPDPIPWNWWLGTTVEDQEQADKRLPYLLGCRSLSPVLFASCEPLLGRVDLTKVEVPQAFDVLRRPWDIDGSKFNALCKYDDDNFHSGPACLDWVIAGGESGPKARASHPDWFRSLRNQCEVYGVPFHFKQNGEWIDVDQANQELVKDYKNAIAMPFGDTTAMVRIGKKASGRLLDGKEYNGFPI